MLGLTDRVALAGAAAVLAVSLTIVTRAQVSPFAALPRTAKAPADNPSTPEKVALGRMLFWDPVLSGAGDIACATCHHPDFGYADGADLPVGTGGTGLGTNRSSGSHLIVKRNSPTILNAAFNGIDVSSTYSPADAPMFWDMRVRSLEGQSLEPIKSLEEMRGSQVSAEDAVNAAVARVAAIAEYRDRFQRAFGGTSPVTAINMARAIATFERTLITPDTPFDRYMRGDRTAMTPAQVRGMAALESSGCTGCHSGPMFSDYTVHVLGAPDNTKLPEIDRGADNKLAFRTPTLRNLAYTAPYMHSGLLKSLESVLDHYQTVGRGGLGLPQIRRPKVVDGYLVQAVPFTPDDLDPLVKKVDSTRDRASIIQFLQALNSDFDRTIPDRVPSGLHPGGATD